MFYDFPTERQDVPLTFNRKEHWCRAHVQLFKLIRKFFHMKIAPATTSSGRTMAINVVCSTSLVASYEGKKHSEHFENALYKNIKMQQETNTSLL